MQLGMLIEADRCIGCHACVSACKEKWNTGPGAQRNWVREYEHGTLGKDLGVTFYPGLCMQCAEHPCTRDCPTGATYQDDSTGIVMVDRDVCIGCGNCISNCAYSARFHDARQGIVEKCNLCAPFLARGEMPACVTTCLAECRHFGDLDDKSGELVRRIKETGAKPLITSAIDLGPRIFYAGEKERTQILAQGVIKPPQKSWLTKVWHGFSLPLSRYVVPAFGIAAVVGGLLINIRTRLKTGASTGSSGLDDQAGKKAAAHPAGPVNQESKGEGEVLERHRTGIRVLHWFNLLSWLVLLLTGTALMSTKSFALFGQGFPLWMIGLFGGKANLIMFHALWGIAWAVITIPIFLVYKKGGWKAIKELRITRDDLKWLVQKPLALLHLSDKPLPPQDKYNMGQKLFALTVLGGTLLIILTGLIMVFHWGPPTMVAAAILVHKLAIAVILMGIAVHVTMAAIIRSERAALKSMVTGKIDRNHAEKHSAKWVSEKQAGQPNATKDPAQKEEVS